jgi:hypothetical protein
MASLEVVWYKVDMTLATASVTIMLALFETVVATDSLSDKVVVPSLAIVLAVVVVLLSTSTVSLLDVSTTREEVVSVGVCVDA